MSADTVIIKSDLRIIHPDYGDMTEEVAREMAAIRREDNERLVHEAARMQAEIAAARPGDAVIHDGFALKAQIHPGVHAYWRMREGPGFWKHELGSMMKKFPELRVRARPANPTVRVDGLKGSEAIAPRRGPVGKRGRWAA